MSAIFRCSTPLSKAGCWLAVRVSTAHPSSPEPWGPGPCQAGRSIAFPGHCNATSKSCNLVPSAARASARAAAVHADDPATQRNSTLNSSSTLSFHSTPTSALCGCHHQPPVASKSQNTKSKRAPRRRPFHGIVQIHSSSANSS